MLNIESKITTHGQENTQTEVQPYKKIFAEIERTAPSPIDAYTYFRIATQTLDLNPIFYTPMAITTAGFQRDPTLSQTEAIQANAEWAQLRKDNLIATINGSTYRDYLIPSELGKIKGWGQTEYILFFMHVIAGLDPKEAAIVEANMDIDSIRQMPGLIDTNLSIDERWKNGYKQLPERYFDLIQKHNLGKGNNGADFPKNIQANILILDPQASLGTNVERYLGYLLGISEYIVSANNPSKQLTDSSNRLRDIEANPSILQAENEISGYQNLTRFWLLRDRGFKFRTPGVLRAISRKNVLREQIYQETPSKTSEQLWAEYYEAA